jgi:hypothetical protein
MPFENNAELFTTIEQLIDAWCDRRCFRALRAILRVYPPPPVLTDDWAELLIGLQDVRAFARDELTTNELETIDDCIRAVDRAIHRN